MKKIIFFIPVLVLISILVSCSSDKEKKVEAEKQLKVEKEILIGNLISKYDIQYKWDTLGYKYSIEYEPVLSSKYQLIDKFTISDIFKKDSSMYIQIRVAYYPTFFFLLSINSDQLDKILTKNADKILVVDISQFKKILFDIENEIEYDSYSVGGGEDLEEFYESYAISSPSFSDDFVGMGVVIEVVSFN